MTDHCQNQATAPPTSESDDPWAGRDIKSLVTSTGEYIVYIDKAINLQWETTAAYDTKSAQAKGYKLADHNLVAGEVAILDARARAEFGLATREEALCLLGGAVVCSLEFDYDSAQKSLIRAEEFLRERSREASRFWYLMASALTTLPFLVCALVVWLNLPSALKALGPTVTWMLLSACAGACGALFSVILRSGKLNLDPWAGKGIHHLEGASRIWAGAFSGLIASLAIKAGLLLGAVAADEKRAVMILAAIAAGSSERLATSIISKIDQTRENIEEARTPVSSPPRSEAK
jgi:hypothetical protein